MIPEPAAPDTLTVAAWLLYATEFLESQNIRSARANAEWLLCHVMNTDRTGLLTQLQRTLHEGEKDRYTELLEHRARHVPLQHLLGSWEFYGRTFLVSPAALIPRPETELLIEHVCAWLAHHPDVESAVDVGTGTGVIAATLAIEVPQLQVYALDVSQDALALARENIARLGVSSRVMAKLSDLGDALLASDSSVSLCVANLPYIAQEDRETLDREVVEYEPETALFSDEAGLAHYRRLIAQLPCLLQKAGPVGFFAEIGPGQASKMETWLRVTGRFTSIETVKDWNGHDRIVKAVSDS